MLYFLVGVPFLSEPCQMGLKALKFLVIIAISGPEWPLVPLFPFCYVLMLFCVLAWQGIQAQPLNDDDMFIWEATIKGPKDTMWEGTTVQWYKNLPPFSGSLLLVYFSCPILLKDAIFFSSTEMTLFFYLF